jgi:galactokinase
VRDTALRLFSETFGDGPEPQIVAVPGRVNLIGEHIDYHNLPVLPIAIQRQIVVAGRPRRDRRIKVVSANTEGAVEFRWTAQLKPDPPGAWSNYVKAAAQAVQPKWRLERGIDAALAADLPPAAGLSSSSALLTAVTLALLQANGVSASFEELMEILPEGEYFVGTRGGGMDHAAVLGSRAGSALLIHFAPVRVEAIPIPRDWAFLVAHSLTLAKKSSSLRAEFNARRAAGSAALERLDLPSFAAALPEWRSGALVDRAARLQNDEAGAFTHVMTEAARVYAAAEFLRQGDARSFGSALNESHASLRDLLRVSNDALDELVAAATASGALGARMTGAGFGGCAIVFCMAADRERVRSGLIERFYSKHPDFDPANHLIDVEPSAGALFA